MPHALLLSPDDQAVNAITGVLEEMSVTCERPLDGVSAAQKINAQSFDLVLVDCENLPAAKLIFDVCRRGKNGNNPVPIAIVDGRAGLPTAFRLGAELILTKPVAKDQARNTIRTAVSRVRKEVPANKVPSPASAEAPSPDATAPSPANQERAQAAAASVSSQLTSFAEPAPSPTTAPAAPPAPVLSADVHSTVDKTEAAPPDPKVDPHPKSAPLFVESSLSPVTENPAPPPSLKPSDDPVLAELERTEREEAAGAQRKNAELDKTPADQLPTRPGAPVSSSHEQGPRKTRGPLVALLLLVLAIGGLYAAWTYQPGFRAIAQPQIDRVLALAGMAHPTQSVPPTPVASAAQRPAAAPVATPATAPADPTQTPVAVTDSAANPATQSATKSPAMPTASAQPTPDTAVTAKGSGSTLPSAPVVKKPETPKSVASGHGDKGDKKDAAASPSSNELPGEKSAIILSSKGAEKRLAHSVSPKYPVEAKSGDAQGTVVLKEVVDENGQVQGVRLVEGNAALATAAIQAVKQWRYRPYVRDGRAQPFQTVVIVDFQRP